jgi:DNA-binding Xre family transcriptional regulator
VHPNWIITVNQRLDDCLAERGYINTDVFADFLKISPSTLRNFLKGIPVDRSNFAKICKELGFKWNDVADFGSNEATKAEPHQDETLVYPEGPLLKTSRLYVHRPEEERALVELRQPGGLARIYAPKRMGKTSLLIRLLGQAEGFNAQSANLDLRKAKEAFKDLALFLKWFCDNVALQVGHDMNLETYEYLVKRFTCIPGSQIYFERYLLPEVEKTFFLGLDRVDELIQYPEICREFLKLVRFFREESRSNPVFEKLRIILVYAKDIEVYVPLPINHSPFSVGLPIELSEFTGQQVLELAELYHLQWSNTEVQSLMSLVGGHPFLVRLALYHVARRDITLPELIQTAATAEGIYGEHLRSISQLLAQKSELTTAMQAVVAGNPKDLSETTQHDLRSLGLVKFDDKTVIPSCDLYRQYFQKPQ